MKEFQHVKYSKGQMKIQEMAFVLVGIFIFFALVLIFYANIRFSGIRQDAQDLKDTAAKELVKTIAGSPEFSWEGCQNCVDLDKVFLLAESKKYAGFWGLDYLKVERVAPRYKPRQCTRGNYPDCTDITIINSSNYGSPAWSYVSLCRYEAGEEYTKCELGKIYASGKQIV